jgi:HNH endonuclease
MATLLQERFAMKQIPLTRGYVALVDDDDFKFVSQFSWHVYIGKSGIYAMAWTRRVNGVRLKVRMHKAILPFPEIDHRDGDGLNNQKHNLRACTRQQNIQNTKARSGTLSPYKGVILERKNGKWRASIMPANGIRISLGAYFTQEEAARAYDTAAKEHFGEFARLNFPEVAA